MVKAKQTIFKRQKKPELIIFHTQRRTLNKFFQIKLDDRKLRPVNEVKYLGSALGRANGNRYLRCHLKAIFMLSI